MKVRVSPTAMAADGGTIRRFVIVALRTVTVALPETPLNVARIVDVPEATPRTGTERPVCTVAIDVCDESQVAVAVTS